MAFAFLVVALLPLLSGEGARIWALVVSAAFLGLAIVWPKSLTLLNRLWFRFGLLLGMVVAPLVLLALFLLAFTPMALGLRIFGKDPLRRKIDPDAPTYWLQRDGAKGGLPSMGSMKNQF